MAYYRKWKPSKTAARQFAETMDDIRTFCYQNNISTSASMDSYYFILNGQEYRVSNHSVESSNKRSRDALGNKIREEYHPDGRKADVIYIHAGKTRIREIYQDLLDGYQLDGKGNRKEG